MVWDRLTPEGRAVLRLAYAEARGGAVHAEPGTGPPTCLADEHVLLGLLRHGASEAATLLRAQGLDLATAREELRRIGPTLPPRASPAHALAGLGIDVEEVRHGLAASFGEDAVRAAERRVRRRPRWRGGHPRPGALCHYLLAKRAFDFAGRLARQRGDAGIGPDQLAYGVLRDARDPLGTRLSRRSRRHLATLGWRPGRPNPVRVLLEGRGIDLSRLTAALGPAA